MIYVNQAMLGPTSVFKDPTEDVAGDTLSRVLQMEILRRWNCDAYVLEVAEDKAGMAVGRPKMFDRVLQALHTRGAKHHTERCSPMK